MMPKSVKRFSDDIMLSLLDSGPDGEVGSILMQTANDVLGSTIIVRGGSHEAAARTVGGRTRTHRRRDRRRFRHRADLDRAGDQSAVA
ncbi:hypothetical protein FJW05_13545 [Mesorhizobium sp. B2-9-1]|nr:hypothetical protein FJW05_13545 [Mesorhizobium sp. B2-9-1]